MVISLSFISISVKVSYLRIAPPFQLGHQYKKKAALAALVWASLDL